MRFRGDLAFREVDGEYFFLTSDSMFHTVSDQVGTFILSLIQTKPGISSTEIVSQVEKEFDTNGTDFRSDVLSFLSELVNKRILEEG